MTNAALLLPKPAPMVACTICRDVSAFEALIGDMEAGFGQRWGDLSFEEAAELLREPDGEAPAYAILAVDQEDADKFPLAAEIVRSAKAQGVGIIVVARDIGASTLHQFLTLGAAEFVPYPIPGNALRDAIRRLTAPIPVAEPAPAVDAQPARKGGGRDGRVLAVHGLAGGVGATTFAVNLAFELAGLDPKAPPRVCLIDLDLQFGSVATYLDLPRREAVFELLTNANAIDAETFEQACLVHREKLHVLTAPPDMLPLDLVSAEDVLRLIEAARSRFDYVVIDMPTAVVQWTETVLRAARVYFALIELDMRSAQNARRLIRALKSDDLPHESLRYVLNRAPGLTDLAGKGRVQRLAEGLEVALAVRLPNGSKAVASACDHGAPLGAVARRNPLRKKIARLAGKLHAESRAAAAA